MKDSGNITANVSLVGDRYIATTPQYPEARGVGATPGEALYELEKALEVHRLDTGLLEKHPLCPTIREWFNSTSGPAVPFLALNEFYHCVEALHLEAAEEKQILQTYDEAAMLGSALLGGDYNEGVHEVLYIAAAHPLGFALAHAAGFASLNQNLFAAFSKSTRLPGFLSALEAWAASNELNQPFEEKELRWIIRNLSAKNHPDANYWQNAIGRRFETTSKFNKALSDEVLAIEAAERDEKRRRTRKVPIRKKADYLYAIKIMWVPGAFWCLSDSQIIEILDPEKSDDVTDAHDKVRRNITTLRFSKSRRKSQES